MKDFDKLWNYSKPDETEEKFREVLPQYTVESDLSGHIQLLTQIARTYSLRRMFDNAHAQLDAAEKLLPATPEVAHVRYYLERGRTLNSSGNIAGARKLFEDALNTGRALGEDYYAIDAIHMIAITATGDEAIKLNEDGVLMAENSTMPRAKGWLGSLYNNLGWSYFDKGDYEKAMSIFLRALKWQQDGGGEREIFIAKWCVARTLRAMNSIDEAITIQLGLLEESVEISQPDGYVYEELGELHLLKNDTVYKMYFGFAYKELSNDIWLQRNESARLERMKKLSE